MKLQDYLSETLKEIFTGLKEAQDHVVKIGGAINPIDLVYLNGSLAKVQHKKTSRIGQEIEFDLEVMVSKGKDKKGKGSISIYSIGIGGEIQSETQNRSVNRVKFKIPVIFPKSEYKEN